MMEAAMRIKVEEDDGNVLATMALEPAGVDRWLIESWCSGVTVNTDLRGVGRGDVWALVQAAAGKVANRRFDVV